MAGAVFENYIVSEVKKTIYHGNIDAEIYYFRSNLGLEVDLIIENKEKKKLDFIEIKNSSTAKQKMLEGIIKLIDLENKSYPGQYETINGLLVYKGITKMFSPGIGAVNYNDFLGDVF